MIISTKAFSAAVTHALVGVAPRPALLVMAGLKLEAADGYLTVSGYDGATQVTEVMSVDGDLPLTLINGALLKDVVTKSRSQTMTLELEDRYLKISAGRAKVRLQTMPADEYPKPLVTPEAGFTLDGSGWGVIARTVSYAAAKDDGLPHLTAVNLTVTPGHLTASATDRYRLSTNTISVDSEVEGSLLVSAKTVIDASRHLDTTATWDVRFSDSLISISDGRGQITRSLLSGHYPDLSKLYPEQTAQAVTAERVDLLDAVSRATSLLGRNEAVRVTVEPEAVTIESGDGDLGAMTETLDAGGYAGDPATLRVNPVYLSEALNALSSDEVTIGWNDTRHPLTVTGDDLDHQQLIMPVRGN